LIHEFRLSQRENGGVFCDEGGAFVGAVPLLARTRRSGKDEWRPRDGDDLSREMSAQYGLPVDMSSKTGGLAAIAKALNEGDVVRAQVATVLLGIPHPPSLAKDAPSRQAMIELARELQWSGLLKAEWDPDEHPRWPAGAADSQGGQFAPKGDDSAAGQLSGEAMESHQPLTDARDAEVSTHPHRRDSGAPPNNPSGPRSNDNGDDDKHDGSDAEDLGVYASYGHYIGGARLADASIALDGLGIPAANPANWANVTRLVGGALKLGSGQIITAAALWTAVDAYRERAAVDDAISRFDLDPTRAADVLAARAYVWTKSAAWLNYTVPSGGPELESVAQSVMAVELARPGTLYLATEGDQTSSRYIAAAVDDGKRGGAIAESRPRPANLPAALQTTISTARAALNLKPNDQKRAHHLIPANVWGKLVDIATLASQAGWQPDSKENLIALPANEAAQAEFAPNLPIHSSSHRDYDAIVRVEIALEREKYGNEPLTPVQARAIFEKVAGKMRTLIETGTWMPRMR
jgi:hypothetical protein